MLKAKKKEKISIKSTQMSAFGPLYCLPSKSSGAAYGGLPHHVESILLAS